MVERIPDGQGIESQQAEVAPVFQEGMDLLAAGDVDAALVRFGDLPEWFGEIIFMGGPDSRRRVAPAKRRSFWSQVRIS